MSTPVNNAAVSATLTAALAAEPLLPGETITDRVSRAFSKLQSRRRLVEPLNINLAAAEHYMYARLLAGVTGDPLVRYAPVLYGLKKRALFGLGLGQWMATTAQPVLPPDDDVERWGTQGATEGLKDYESVRGMAADKHGQAARALADQALHYR